MVKNAKTRVCDKCEQMGPSATCATCLCGRERGVDAPLIHEADNLLELLV